LNQRMYYDKMSENPKISENLLQTVSKLNIANPYLFGPPLWDITHMQAKRLDIMLAYIRETGDKTYEVKAKVLWNYLNNLEALIPCEQCTKNHAEFVRRRPLPVLESKEAESGDCFFNWSVDHHNHVNRLTGKRELSHEEAAQFFQQRWGDERKSQMSVTQLGRVQDAALIENLKSRIDYLEKFGNKWPAWQTVMVTALLTLFVVILLGILAKLVIR
jgi:hypothetical protein